VSNTLTLNRTAGATTIVATGGVPADNGNGAIQRLYRLDSGSSFTFTAVVNSQLARPSAASPTRTCST
jgi:hypothetical protein